MVVGEFQDQVQAAEVGPAEAVPLRDRLVERVDVALVLADQGGEQRAPPGQGGHRRSRRLVSRPRRIRSGG